MKEYINPPEFLDEQRKRLEDERDRISASFPENPQKDILLFLLNYAPLERWQHTVLEIIRDEAYYFAPQGMTKILTRAGPLSGTRDHDRKSRARLRRSSTSPSTTRAWSPRSPQRLNPYKLGLELLRDIEDRWNQRRVRQGLRGVRRPAEKRAWDKELGLGREKLFEVRRFHNDITFIDEFLTPEFVFDQKLFSFRYNRDTDLYEIASREFEEIKQKLLYRLTNFGQPFIYVEDGNYSNRGELYLRHRHEGVDLRVDYARDMLRNIFTIWTRPVHLETVVDDKKRLLTFDGRDYSERRID